MSYDTEIERYERKLADAEGELNAWTLKAKTGELPERAKRQIVLLEQMSALYGQTIHLLRSLDKCHSLLERGSKTGRSRDAS